MKGEKKSKNKRKEEKETGAQTWKHGRAGSSIYVQKGGEKKKVNKE